ncbi:MAG: NAD(P)H-hydrate dehydratase [Omnitrophica bacterium RIFCSPHIGHO2_02_FULL_63_14]|nr:MAG: NAD(P)H-hydrate dehydratase [Omnitrophica bacterium RIFCSPHIGHO2_02_FULL_63_14]
MIKGFRLLPRKKSSDKSRYGHVLVLAGSRGLDGAAVLASRAALEAGAGLVTLGIPKGLQKKMRRVPPEIMLLPLPETRRGSLHPRAFATIRKFIQNKKVNAVALGPGLSTRASTAALVRRLVKTVRPPIVLDADGLNAFKGKAVELQAHAGPLVMTPHDREFTRLFEKVPPRAALIRVALAKHLARHYASVLVMKGRRSVVSDGRRTYVNRTGNPGMAKGGTGDALTGMIAAFIAQGLGAFEAARWGVYFHGRAGDAAARKKGVLSLTAGDLIDFFPKVFR